MAQKFLQGVADELHKIKAEALALENPDLETILQKGLPSQALRGIDDVFITRYYSDVSRSLLTAIAPVISQFEPDWLSEQFRNLKQTCINLDYQPGDALDKQCSLLLTDRFYDNAQHGITLLTPSTSEKIFTGLLQSFKVLNKNQLEADIYPYAVKSDQMIRFSVPLFATTAEYTYPRMPSEVRIPRQLLMEVSGKELKKRYQTNYGNF
jgi:hypothetical protein